MLNGGYVQLSHVALSWYHQPRKCLLVFRGILEQLSTGQIYVRQQRLVREMVILRCRFTDSIGSS